MILDASFHHSAMKKLPDGRRRGRPDITHLFLLTALESIVNKKGQLTVVVHTRNNKAIYVNPETRLMRNYTRFIGLMEQLFEKEIIETDEKILLQLQHDITLKEIIEKTDADMIMGFSTQGKHVQLPEYFSTLKKKKCPHLLCIIGGFPSGDFQCDLTAITQDIISLYDDMLSAWTVASEILVNYENIFLRCP